MSFDDFLAEIDNLENIKVPKNYIMIEHGYTKKKSKKQNTKSKRQ